MNICTIFKFWKLIHPALIRKFRRILDKNWYSSAPGAIPNAGATASWVVAGVVAGVVNRGANTECISVKLIHTNYLGEALLRFGDCITV
jgi:hypothetical protein